MFLTLGLLGQLISGTASTDESATYDANHDQVAEPANVKSLWLPQTRSDWNSVVSEMQSGARHSGTAIESGLEDVTVTAPAELLPMDDVYDEMWGGVLAPVWAILHPTQAWRIFLPIPPKKVTPSDK
jgi:hypothetical protein